MSDIDFQLGDNFNVYIKNRPDLRDGILKVAEQYGITNKTDLLKKMIELSLAEAPATAPAKPVKPPKARQEGIFSAQVDPMDQELVESMRLDLWKDKRLKNAGILSYFATIHHKLKEKTLFLVKPPKGITKKLLDTAEPLIDEGEIQSISQYISIVLRDHFRSLSKPPREKPAEPKAEPKAESSPEKAPEAEKKTKKWTW
ncbi:MAG: hypothetical protein MRZ79_12465 [Bacteroidia bacterium]|nr:hypothetical protein [Bacteroidia bacterium]